MIVKTDESGRTLSVTPSLFGENDEEFISCMHEAALSKNTRISTEAPVEADLGILIEE